MPPQLPSEKTYALSINRVEANNLLHGLRLDATNIEQQVQAIDASLIGQFSYETLMDYYSKRREVNKELIKKLTKILE